MRRADPSRVRNAISSARPVARMSRAVCAARMSGMAGPTRRRRPRVPGRPGPAVRAPTDQRRRHGVHRDRPPAKAKSADRPPQVPNYVRRSPECSQPNRLGQLSPARHMEHGRRCDRRGGHGQACEHCQQIPVSSGRLWSAGISTRLSMPTDMSSASSPADLHAPDYSSPGCAGVNAAVAVRCSWTNPRPPPTRARPKRVNIESSRTNCACQ